MRTESFEGVVAKTDGILYIQHPLTLLDPQTERPDIKKLSYEKTDPGITAVNSIGILQLPETGQSSNRYRECESCSSGSIVRQRDAEGEMRVPYSS
jgi:hypothetical protein